MLGGLNGRRCLIGAHFCLLKSPPLAPLRILAWRTPRVYPLPLVAPSPLMLSSSSSASSQCSLPSTKQRASFHGVLHAGPGPPCPFHKLCSYLDHACLFRPLRTARRPAGTPWEMSLWIATSSHQQPPGDFTTFGYLGFPRWHFSANFIVQQC